MIRKLLPALALALTTLPARAVPSLMSLASPLRDVSLRSSVVSRNVSELDKISPEFAQSYRFAESDLSYKEPNKLRLVSKAGFVSVTYVISGNTKELKAGFIHKTWDIAGKPGQRQTALTVGLLTPSFVESVNATYHGADKVDDRAAVVYDAHFKDEPRGTWHRLYLDAARKVLLRDTQFHGDGKLKVDLKFMYPVNVNGVWVPTRTEVYNAQSRQGAVTKIANIRVNTNPPDTAFRL